VVGFAASLLGSLIGLLVAGFVGYACGKRCGRAAAESAGGASGDGASGGAWAGMLGGAIAVPVFVAGATAGALLSIRSVEREEMARLINEFGGLEVSPDGAWALFLVSIAIFAVLQAFVFVLASTIAGALAARSPAKGT